MFLRLPQPMFLRLPQLSRYQAINNPTAPLVSMSKAKQEKVLNTTAVRIEEYLSTLARPAAAVDRLLH